LFSISAPRTTPTGRAGAKLGLSLPALDGVATGLRLPLDARLTDKLSGIFSLFTSIVRSSKTALCASQSSWDPSHNNSVMGKSSLLSPHACRS
jgi:hypothetical protein